MSRCKHTEDCAFYQNRLSYVPRDQDFLRNRYCHQQSDKCIRLKNAENYPLAERYNNLTP